MALSYSQNAEDLLIYSCFKGKTGTLLEIGANDGETLSNSKFLIDKGWSAHLIEPGHTFTKLEQLHKGKVNVKCYNFALGHKFVDSMTFWESGAHVPGGSDSGLVSTLDFEETERWRRNGVQFKETIVKIVDFDKFWRLAGEPNFDLISIDVEGHEWDILSQIDLNKVGCQAIIIEWNGIFERKVQFENYILPFSFKLIDRNNENLIFVKR